MNKTVFGGPIRRYAYDQLIATCWPVRPPPLVPQSVITDGDWHRVGFVWDGSQRILYVDDVEVAKDTKTQLAGSTGDLYIGTGRNLDAGNFFSGLIDDIRIHSAALRTGLTAGR